MALKLYLSGLQVHLSSSQAILLLLKVGRMAAGTLVRWHEPGRLLGKNLTVNVVTHAWQGVAVDVVEVILWVVPREDLDEGAQQGDVGPGRARGDGTLRRLVTDEVLQFHWEGRRRVVDPKRQV